MASVGQGPGPSWDLTQRSRASAAPSRQLKPRLGSGTCEISCCHESRVLALDIGILKVKEMG